MGYSIDGGFGEYATAYGRYVVQGARGHRSLRRGAAHVRRGHDLQGRQGGGHPLLRPGCGLRSRRARPHGDPVRPHRRRPGGRRRPDRREARPRPRARRRVHGERGQGRPDRGDPGAGRSGSAIALAVSPRSFEQAYGSLRRGGTLVFVALPADNHISLPIFETVLNGITVVGSIVGTRTDLREVFELHAAGRTNRDARSAPAERSERVDRRRRGRPRAGTHRVPAVGKSRRTISCGECQLADAASANWQYIIRHFISDQLSHAGSGAWGPIDRSCVGHLAEPLCATSYPISYRVAESGRGSGCETAPDPASQPSATPSQSRIATCDRESDPPSQPAFRPRAGGRRGRRAGGVRRRWCRASRRCGRRRARGRAPGGPG